jgi:TonB family protein
MISVPALAQSSSARILSEVLADNTVIAPAPTAPLIISDSEYPLAALTAAEEGDLTLNLLVGAQGRVTFAQRLTSSGSEILDQTAQQIARTRWIFQPAKKDGEAVVGSVRVEVSWKLPLRPADDLGAQMLGAPVLGRRLVGPSIIREAYRITSADYPPASVRAREQGEVVLSVLVLEDGAVGDVRVLSSSRFPRLDERAMQLATEGFKYRPGTVAGQPSRMSLTVNVPFVLSRVPPSVALKFCRSVPVMSELFFAINPESEESAADLASQATIVALQYHVNADGTVDDVIIPTKRGWMHFNEAMVQNVSRVAAFRPAALANRPPSCWFDGRTVVAPMQQNSAEALLQSGVANSRTNDADQAIEDFTKAIAINPNLAQAYYNRAVAYRARGDDDSALKDYEQALRINPGYVAASINLANVYRRRGQFEEAIKLYDQALKLNPRTPVLFSNRCITLAIWGKAREGLADCDRAVRLSSRYPEALSLRGFAYHHMGNYRAAIADYDAAIKAVPAAAEPRYGRGVAKLRLGNAAEGNADIAEAIKLDPQIVEKMAVLGVAP